MPKCLVLEPGKEGTYGNFITLWYKNGRPMQYCSGKKYYDNGNTLYDSRCLQCSMCEVHADLEFRQYVGSVLVKASKPHNIISDLEARNGLCINCNALVKNASCAGLSRERYIRCLISEFVNKNCKLMERFLYDNYYEKGYTKKSIKEFFGIGEGAYNKVRDSLLTKVGIYLCDILV